MVVFPNCKINLGLNILRKRDDGFHDLETFFYPIILQDALEMIRDTDNNTGPVFTSSGLDIDGPPEHNLCLKAWHLLKNDFPDLPPVKIHLHKVIPMGAGLGGGSADASLMLLLLNNQFKLELTGKQLQDYAARLGSDCPFFIYNRPCLAGGRGEILEPVALDLSAYHIKLINPGIHIPTAWAFSQLNPSIPQHTIREIIQQPIGTWKETLTNDFETPVFAAHPQIKEIKERLYQEGAVYAAMSGSGSTVFGIFEKEVPVIDFDPSCFVKTLRLTAPPANPLHPADL